jgi:quercetin dioxygenase-like cupin family protein
MRLLEPEFTHSDNRRTITQLFSSKIEQVNIYNAKKDSVLGNHFHKETTEYFYILKGVLMVNDERILSKYSLFCFDPGERHTLLCITDVTFMTFLSKAYDQSKPDIYR